MVSETERATKLETRDDGLYILAWGEEYKVLKGWESFSGWYWFATEINKNGLCFGFVQGTHPEWGYFSTQEIEELGNMAWPIKACDLPHAGRRFE